MACFLAAFEHGQFFMKASDHFADACLRETFRSNRVRLPQPTEPFFKIPKLFLDLFILCHCSDHNSISTSPFRRPSISRVRLKNSTHSFQSVSSSAANTSSGRRVSSISSNSVAVSTIITIYGLIIERWKKLILCCVSIGVKKRPQSGSHSSNH